MNVMLKTLRKFPRKASDWLQATTPKLDLLIDKYKLIKMGCLVGIGKQLMIKLSMGFLYMMAHEQSWLSGR